jgi:hypothetical protein
MSEDKVDLKLAREEYEMTAEELDEFLNGRPRFGSIASLRKTGSPIVDGIGFEWDGEFAYFSVRDTRALRKRLDRDQRVCLHVMNTEYPVRWVRLEGVAEPIADPGYERTLRIMRKYMTAESDSQELDDFQVDEFAKAYVEFGRTLYRLRLTRLHSHDANKQSQLYDLTTGRLRD